MQPGGFVPVVPFCGVCLSGRYDYPLTIIKVPVLILYTNLNDEDGCVEALCKRVYLWGLQKEN